MVENLKTNYGKNLRNLFEQFKVWKVQKHKISEVSILMLKTGEILRFYCGHEIVYEYINRIR